MIKKMKAHIERMLDGRTSSPITLMVGEDVFESATGASRGEGSICVLEATRHTQCGVVEMLEINDEVRGYRGTQAKADFYKILDEEGVLANSEGRTLLLVLDKRDRRAMWQELNDDSARGGIT